MAEGFCVANSPTDLVGELPFCKGIFNYIFHSLRSVYYLEGSNLSSSSITVEDTGNL